MKYLFSLIFLIISLHSNTDNFQEDESEWVAFDEVRKKWFEAMEQHNVLQAEEIYSRINVLCNTINKKINIECEIFELVKKYWFQDTNLLEDESITLKALKLLDEIRDNNLMLYGTKELFDIINSNLYISFPLDGPNFEKFIDHYEWHLENFENTEYKIYMLEAQSEYFALIGDYKKELDNLELILSLISTTDEELDWSGYKRDAEIKILENYFLQNKSARVIEFSMSLLSNWIESQNEDLPPIELIELLIELGSTYAYYSDYNRGNIFYKVAYEYLLRFKEQINQVDLDFALDNLTWQLLPDLNCDDSEKFQNFVEYRNDILKKSGVKEEDLYSPNARRSMLLEKIYCGDNDIENENLANEMLNMISSEINTEIKEINELESTMGPLLPTPSYYLSLLIQLTDLTLYVEKSDYLNVVLPILDLFNDRIENFIQGDVNKYTVYKILSIDLCALPKDTAKKNIKNMHRILNETNIVELFESESEVIPLNELSEILLTSILIPSSCGYEKEVRSFAEKFLNAQAATDIYNQIPENINDYFAISSLIMSEYPDVYDEKYAMQSLKFLNREPVEIELKLNKLKDEKIIDYLKFQAKLYEFEDIVLNLDSENLNHLNDFIKSFEKFASYSDLNLQFVNELAQEKLFSDFELADVQSKLKSNEALIIYSAYWYSADDEITENFTQLCITNKEFKISSKVLSSNELELLFNVSENLLRDLVLDKNQYLKISKDYSELFSRNFSCNPMEYNEVSFITDIPDYFNPNLFIFDEYFIKEAKIRIFPNIYEFLERVNLKNIKYTDYVGFGDIDYKNTAYDELKDSKEEIISSSVHFRNKQIFLGKDANTHSLKDFKNSIIHFAAHNDRVNLRYNSVKSALVLSKAQDDNRYLTATDIGKKDFSGSFIILSACSTKNSNENIRNSTSSIYNAFLIAGARGIVSTTWDIDSSAAKEFTTKFIRNLSKDTDIYDEFKTVQINMIESEKFYHPYYWAGFNLYY